MKKYVAILKDKNKDALTDGLLEAHAEYLRNLRNQGKLWLCGPFEDDETAIQVLVADSANEARLLVQADPFVENGYYGDFEVRGLIEANEANNFLMGDPDFQGSLHH